MNIKYEAFLKNQTWCLLPLDPSYDIVGNKLVFCIKRNVSEEEKKTQTFHILSLEEIHP